MSSSSSKTETKQITWNIGDYNAVMGLVEQSHHFPEMSFSIGQHLGFGSKWKLQYGEDIVKVTLLEMENNGRNCTELFCSFSFVIKCTMSGSSYVAEGKLPRIKIEMNQNKPMYEIPCEFQSAKSRWSLGIPTAIVLKGDFILSAS
jgi:hypothetical protein